MGSWGYRLRPGSRTQMTGSPKNGGHHSAARLGPGSTDVEAGAAEPRVPVRGEAGEVEGPLATVHNCEEGRSRGTRVLCLGLVSVETYGKATGHRTPWLPGLPRWEGALIQALLMLTDQRDPLGTPTFSLGRWLSVSGSMLREQEAG